MMRAAPIAVLMCFALAVPARAQMDSREGIMLQNQILELRRDLQALQFGRVAPVPPQQGRGAPQGAGANEITAQLLDRVTRLEEEMRRQRGQLDELANQTRRQAEDLSKQIADLQFRLQSGTQAPTAPPGTAPDPPNRGEGGGAGRRPPELAMQEGNAALARRDYAAAEAAAREVLAGGRAAPRSGDAQFLLAQSLAGKRDFAGAAVAFDETYNRSRTGSRAPDALLGLANSLLALNERPAACATLDKLRAEFPTPRPAFRDAAAAARGRGGCR